MLLARSLAAIALIACGVWLGFDPKFDSLAATLAAATALATLFIAPKLRAARQSQTVADKSVGIQAGGDVHIGTIDASRKGRGDAE